MEAYNTSLNLEFFWVPNDKCIEKHKMNNEITEKRACE